MEIPLLAWCNSIEIFNQQNMITCQGAKTGKIFLFEARLPISEVINIQGEAFVSRM